MSIHRISHVGIAVHNLEEQVRFYRDDLGLTLVRTEVIADQQVRVAMFAIGESMIELLAPLTPESPIAKFLKKRGQGIHHVAYKVEGLEKMLGDLDAKGVDLIDKSPKNGAHGQRIAFLHPKATFGVLTELCE